jgi:hypothetical protein
MAIFARCAAAPTLTLAIVGALRDPGQAERQGAEQAGHMSSGRPSVQLAPQYGAPREFKRSSEAWVSCSAFLGICPTSESDRAADRVSRRNHEVSAMQRTGLQF